MPELPLPRRRASRRRPPCRRARPAGHRPRLEPLEDRTLPSLTTSIYPVTGGTVGAVAVGDFDGNGVSDIVYSTGSVGLTEGVPLGQGTVGVVRNLGTGKFQPLTPAALDGTPGRSIAVGDFNHDGIADAAVPVTVNSPDVGASAGEVALLLGTAGGIFQAPVYLSVGDTQELGITAADLNHDGNADLVVAGASGPTGRATVLLGTGTGAFLPGGSYLIANAGEVGSRVASAVTVGDFTGDGTGDDVAVASYLTGAGAGQVNVFTNDGTGTLVPLPATIPLAAASEPTAIAAADLNGDGLDDFAVTVQGLNQFHVALNEGGGTFATPARYTVGASSAGVAVADFNHDGRPDLAVGVYGGAGTIDVFLNTGNGTMKAPVSFAGGIAPAAADFNHDGLPDLAAADQSPSAVSVLMNNGSWQSAVPAAVAKLQVAGYVSPTAAGAAHSFTVTALDSAGHVATGYTGTVHFTSTDPHAVLPANYTFTAGDRGVHTFTATLKTAGTQSIKVADVAASSVTGSQANIQVVAAAASQLALTGPSAAVMGSPFTVTVTVLDAYGNVATGYRGTVHFASSDDKAQLPADYTFTASDSGVHSFAVTLQTPGQQTVSVQDVLNSALSDEIAVIVGKQPNR